MALSDYVQIILSILTIVGAMYAVRYEVRSRVDNLNQQVIELQDRKIRLLGDELAAVRAKAAVDLAERDKRITELEGTVQTLLRERDERRRSNRRIEENLK